MKILSQRLRWGLLAGLLFTILAVAFFLLGRQPKPPPFMVLSRPIQMPVMLRDRLLQWVPRGWSWVWRLETAVRGRPKVVTVYADVVSLADSSDAMLSSFSLGRPSFIGTNGLQVWVLGSDRLKELKGRLNPAQGAEMLGHPGISTANGRSAQMFQGESLSLGGSRLWAGINLLFSAQVHSDYTDIITGLIVSEFVTNSALATIESPEASSISIQTNLDAAVRLRVPKGSGFFLLDRRSHNSAGKRFGVIMNLPQAGN